MLASPLSPEDQTVQSMPDASPTKWHLAHTTWFFETFLLRAHSTGYRVFHPAYEHLFNSYYNSIGDQFPRPQRGLISRPTSAEVLDYRHAIDAKMAQLLSAADESILRLCELGLHHEQQHQELLLTDIKHVLSHNPLGPSYAPQQKLEGQEATREMPFVAFDGGIHTIGHGGGDFHFDNESPQHQVLIGDFEISARPLNNGDVLAFMEAGGYEDPLLWLSDGWDFVRRGQLSHPFYFRESEDGGYEQFSMDGWQPVEPAETAAHLSYFEADALARFFGARLPTEQEWELVARREQPREPGFDMARLRPGVATMRGEEKMMQMFGGVWEWTQSPYVPYPGFMPAAGAVGEYNGKFMHNQIVLRGGSCFTPSGHIRESYRNFFPGSAQWQMTGARLARGVK